MSRTSRVAAALVSLAALLMAGQPSSAAPDPAPVSGAIFTTDSSGVPVNLNHYPNKQAVYLNGGPGLNAPDDAAGLPDGTYSFQVTDPSGKVLLSEDDVACRQFTVVGGVIQDVTPGGACAHATGPDGEDGGATVQLYPFRDTPNNGGVYKVWVTPTTSLDCDAPGNSHCFAPKQSKTDNFKVREDATVEIDARFWKNGVALLGMAAHWTDTNGASNVKFSEYAPELLAFREAHIEAVEPGTHVVTVADQAGCTISKVRGSRGENVRAGKDGIYRVSVDVATWRAGADVTYRVEVTCR
jgi:hypothetical protein